MSNIYVKINGFDEISNSLLVSFASDTTKSQDPSQYQSFSYQPLTMWPDNNDMSQIPKLLAIAGAWHTQQQTILESYQADPTKQNELKALVGQTFTFTPDALANTPKNEVIV